MIHHVCFVLLLLWLLSSFNCCNALAYFLSLIYIYLVHERYVMRLQRKIKFEESRHANQRRALSDSETVRWLNHVVEKMWPICLEQIVSQKLLLPIVPWFLQKYKPWTVKEATVQHLYLGRSQPMFTDMRVLRQSSDDDHLVLELGMNFLTANDMGAILAVKLTKRLGLGIWTKMHLMGMHIEGRVLIGIKFLHKWPFLGRLRICFVEPPYFQTTIKPIFPHGVDVTELPGLAGWLDKLLAHAFEQTLVEPNMLVVDVEKFASPQQENWFSIDAKDPIAYVIVEVVEATDMKPSDFNGLADPYVKGQVGAYRFRTTTQKKTLTPKWQEEFKIPICAWEPPNVLDLEVRDKDRFVDDPLGDCSVNIGDFRDGQRHEMWLSLQNIKMGRLHLAITVLEGNTMFVDPVERETLDTENKQNSSSKISERSPKSNDKYEPVDIEGQEQTGIWVHHPGSEVPQIWEAKKGKSRHLDPHTLGEGCSSTGSFKSSVSGHSSNIDDKPDDNRAKQQNPVLRGLQKTSSIFHRSPRKRTDKSNCFTEFVPSPRTNIKPTNSRGININYALEDNISADKAFKTVGKEIPGQNNPKSHSEGHATDMASSISKHSGESTCGTDDAVNIKF